MWLMLFLNGVHYTLRLTRLRVEDISEWCSPEVSPVYDLMTLLREAALSLHAMLQMFNFVGRHEPR